MPHETYRITVDMEGILQGVGFRPTVQRLAALAGLSGWVQNRSGSVRMVLGGSREDVLRFVTELPAKLPPRARLDRLTTSEPQRQNGEVLPHPFAILESAHDEATKISIPADLASCASCRAEVFDPRSRYYRYPFTTCTDCGPRYTVVDGMPYDRERTALSLFPLCDACQAEYRDPTNRRFHAESIACPRCGPALSLQDAQGLPIGGDAIVESRRLLAQGALVAVRGLGGFLLACDAYARSTIARLRLRKHRPDKPLAVMARDLETLRATCVIDDDVASLLASPISPIVVVAARPGVARPLPVDALAPDTHEIGVMLPTTPLHALLFAPTDGDSTQAFDFLVMTSGNRGGEPIAIANDEAIDRLRGIADAFLVHDRPIRLRCDDSLVALSAGAPQVWRRARGYAPEALVLASPLRRTVLALGAELKNAIAVGSANEVVLSPHIGDLETPEAEDGLREVVARLPGYLRREPQVIAVDAHPDMRSTRLGRALAASAGLPVVTVQHHHAHAVAALAEHGLARAIAIVFDGTGLGDDGAIWGAEALDAHSHGFRRVATFAPVALPGGDVAVREPSRQLLARFVAAGVEPTPALLARHGIDAQAAPLWAMQVVRGLNAPLTHAAGRVFDAFAAALGIAPARISYEGQAAVRLEAVARRARANDDVLVPFTCAERDDLLLIDWSPAFALRARRGVRLGEAPALAFAFHRAMAEAALSMARRARDGGAPSIAVLTGGVFMNRLLVELARQALEADGFQVLLPRAVPPNDGGIALGQAVIAGGLA